MQVPPWVTGSFSEQVWRVDILRTAGPVYSNMDQEAAWKLRSLRLLRPQRTPPTPPGPPPAQPSPRPRRHFPEVVPAPLPGPADGTALTFRRNAILGLHCWPLCRIVILAPGTQNRDARDGRGSPRRARPRSRAQAERGCPPRPRPAPPGARIRAGQSARRARPGERCAGAHLALGGGVGLAGRGAAGEVRPGRQDALWSRAPACSVVQGELGPSTKAQGREQCAPALGSLAGLPSAPCMALASCLNFLSVCLLISLEKSEWMESDTCLCVGLCEDRMNNPMNRQWSVVSWEECSSPARWTGSEPQDGHSLCSSQLCNLSLLHSPHLSGAIAAPSFPRCMREGEQCGENTLEFDENLLSLRGN
ncbi:uncharacterized protein [Bos taurus]|uniref:uncharacterized protein isoform X1 n=1 Tax=Bos taurus TaxID=9913 RepID=UPI0028CB1DA3|nr:uncharacterized protein LOC101907107 isoform X1 [Bos taurus]XP_059734347.1 uncharacterized protein LOC101907107 isoform X1 [Bos taurus]